MTIRSLPAFFIIAALAVGCKPADNAAATTDSTKPAAATTGDAKTTADASAPATTPDAAAAASGNSIVGTWTSEDKEDKDVLFEFKDDGTGTMTGPNPANPKVSMEATVTYKIDGDKATLKPTGLKMTAPDDADAKTKKEVEDANKAMPAEIAKQPASVGTIKWVDKDTFTVTPTDGPNKGKAKTYKRKV